MGGAVPVTGAAPVGRGLRGIIRAAAIRLKLTYAVNRSGFARGGPLVR